MSSAPEQAVLNEVQIEDALTETDGWEFKSNRLVRSYVFPTFKEAIEFVNDVARLSEEMNHHPDILIYYKKVKFQLWNHKLNGITPIDFAMARKITDLAINQGYS
jgi:4a-hydroxytetrahydrobiopterin dehydratase